MTEDQDLAATPKNDRLDSLTQPRRNKGLSTGYSRFIRIMRLTLPLLALMIVALLFLWPDMESTIEPVARETILPDVPTMQNELVKPRYESQDSDGQPFTITADKASQDPTNPELVLLDNPTADIVLNSGAWVAAKADSAIYEQQSEKLMLRGTVRMFHDGGYTMEADEMRINLKAQEAYSDSKIKVYGPEGTIDAIGLEASGANNTLIFKGPAKMIITETETAMNLGSVLP